MIWSFVSISSYYDDDYDDTRCIWILLMIMIMDIADDDDYDDSS